jgi:hypothetical protein
METKIQDRLEFDVASGVCQNVGATDCVAIFWSNKHHEICWDDITEVATALVDFGCDVDIDLIDNILQNKYVNAVSYELGMIDSAYDVCELIGWGNPYDDIFWHGVFNSQDFRDTVVCIRKEHDISKLSER